MTNRQLEEKFRDQAVLALPDAQVERVIEQCWAIEDLNDVGELAAAAVPAPVRA